MEYILSVDLGTGGPKVGLVEPDGSLARHEFEPVDLHLGPGGAAEQDPGQWWAAIATAARRVVELQGIDPNDVIGVSCTSQWSGTVAVGESKPIGNAIIWMDSRGAGLIRDLIAGRPSIEGYGVAGLQRWIRLTGGAPGKSGKDPLAHILWLRAHRPEVYTAADVFLEPKDYLNFVLTGRAAATYDSIALHWVTDNRDPSAVRYDDRLLAFTGLERGKLPELIAATDVVGPLLPGPAAELGVPAGIPVIGGTPDLHSAAIGSGGAPDLVPHLYVGTSSWLSCHVPYKKTDIVRNVASVPAAMPGRYLVVNEQETAGACLDFLADTMFLDAPDEDRNATYRRFDEMAGGASPGSGGVLFAPWLVGERTPVEDATLRGAFFNLSLDTTPADMVRAVFEGVAYNARWLLSAVERFVKQPFPSIALVGGGAKSEVWAQIFADVTGRTIRRMEDPIAVNVRGAGLLGFLALGKADARSIAAAVPIAQEHEPDRSSRSIHDLRYDEFVAFHKANRRGFRRLNG